MAVLQNAGGAAKGDQRGRRGGNQGGGDTNIFKIVKMIMERQFAPVIIFSFSKKECEIYAMQMAKLDFNTGLCILFFLHSPIHLHNVVLNSTQGQLSYNITFLSFISFCRIITYINYNFLI